MRRSASLLFVALLVGCSQDPVPPAPSKPVAQATASLVTPQTILFRPRTQSELPTTNARIFMGNLDARVSAGAKVWHRNPGSSAAALLYAGPRIARGKLHGDLDEIAAGLSNIDQAVAGSPRDAALLSLHSGALSTLHRFDEALKSEKRAHELAPSNATRAALADLAYNLGQYDDAIPEIRALAERHPSLSNLVKLAHLEQDLGNIDAAERSLARAETLFRDVSPLPIAWLDVQRGLFYLHTGRFEKAEQFYRAAVERLPDYPMAIEHLAEVEALLGKTDAARKHYEKVIALTGDPEFMGALASIEEARGMVERAADLRQRAEASYRKRMKKFPAAMAWHAAEFFLSVGNPARAQELLTENAKLRPNAISWSALAKAELRAGKLDDAAAHVDRVLATPLRRADLLWTAARVRKAQGKTRESQRLASDARSQNPKIEILEGSL